jgi:6-phosphogluconate dehydrogenase
VELLRQRCDRHGDAWYRDSQRRAARLAAGGLKFVDAGVSGGVWGLTNGYGLMVGGSADAVAQITPLLQALAPAPDRGWLHCGRAVPDTLPRWCITGSSTA